MVQTDFSRLCLLRNNVWCYRLKFSSRGERSRQGGAGWCVVGNLATWGPEWGGLRTLQGRQIINQEKKVELYSLGEIDLEGMEGILSKHAISKAFLYYGSKTICNLTGMELSCVFPPVQPGSAGLAASLRRAEVELHVRVVHTQGSVEGRRWTWGQWAQTFGTTVVPF